MESLCFFNGKRYNANMVDNKSLTGALVKMGLVKMGLDREAAEENACRIERFITEEAFEVIKKCFDV